MNNVYNEMKNFTERMTYAIEFEQTIHKTSFNLFAKYDLPDPGKPTNIINVGMLFFI